MTKYDEIMKEISLTPEARERIINNVTERMDNAGETVKKVKVDTARLRNVRIRKIITAAACLVLLVVGSYGISRTDMFNELVGSSKNDMAIESETAYETEGEPAAEEAPAEDLEGNYQVQGDSGAAEEPSDSLESDRASEGSSNGTDGVSDESTYAEEGAPAEEGAADNESVIDSESISNESKSAEITWDMKEFGSEEELSKYLGFTMNHIEFDNVNKDAGFTEKVYRVISGNIGEIDFTDGTAENYYRKSVGTEDISGDYNEYKYMIEFDGERVSGTLKGDSPEKYQLAVWSSIDGYIYAAYFEAGLKESEWNKIIDDCVKGE